MDGEERTMARKRAKHYNETTSIISIAFIIFGVCSAIVLSILWPQKFSAEVFNSKLSYRLLLNIEDYLTCHKDYINFVIDEPIARDSMINFFLFNITNTINVIQRGVEPNIREIGPFGYTKFTYKYDIEFDPIDSLFVTFKEFSILTEVTDPDLCEEMYFRMDRDYLEATPCSNDQCKCKNVDQLLTIINPLFLKLLWEDSPHLLLAHYSVDVFENVKNLLDEPFTEAVQAHLVSEGMKEVYLFRLNYQILQVINTALTDLLQFYTLQQIAETFIPNNECGLQIYGIAGCPFKPFGIRQNVLITFRDIDASNYPSMLGLIDATKPYSFLNDNTAFYKYLGYIWALDVLPFNGGNGYTMVSQSEMLLSFEQLIDEYAKDSFNTNTLTANQRLGTRRILRATLNFLGITFISQYSIVSRRLQPLVNIEFRTTSDPVICAPSGEMCVWQWGYMRNVLNAPQAVSNDLAFTLIDPGSETNTNPNNFYKDLFAPSYYNSHLYCTQLLPIPANDNNFNINCTNLKFTIDDGLVNKPAGLWGVDNGVSAVNQTNLYFRFKQQPATIRKSYMYFACNMSYLLHNVYRTQTPFHDNFVVRFVNKYQDPLLNHTFTVGNWNELGIAQWGGGYITQAIAGVRTINQVVRDGMWRFGSDNLYNVLIEYASWATREGYPNTWISSVEDAKTLLFALARRDDIGVELRRLILFRGSTFIGDGVNFENGVGEVGEITYTTEANLGNFSCTGENAAACSLLNEFYASSAANCLFIQELHDSCVNQFNFLNNRWINFDNCVNFQTSLGNPSLGIPCDLTFLYGKRHPFPNSRGNVVYRMVLSMTLTLVIFSGLWCTEAATCTFTFGGLFTTTSPRKLLFDGYTEPSVLKYYNLKYAKYNVSFQCANEPFDQCGDQLYSCDSDGVVMKLPYDNEKLLLYGATEKDEYYAPYFVVNVDNGELVWPFSFNKTLADLSKQRMIEGNYTRINNPFYTAYPAWDTNDIDFNRLFQCSKRTLGGMPGLFPSCEDTLATGVDDVLNAFKLIKFQGNESVYFFDTPLAVDGATEENQLSAYLWDGFLSYPYNYLGSTAGPNYRTLRNPILFSKQHSMNFELSQDLLKFDFEKDIDLGVPFRTTSNPSFLASVNARRFVEDRSTWQRLRTLGTPTDFFGMPYIVPEGMASLEKLTGFPVFAGTPHNYGNLNFGGREYTHVTGAEPNADSQRTFVDYDPITGRGHRRAFRQQILLRPEQSPMFPNVFTSLQRCTPPTKAFTESTGYGCFTYVPLFWFEDAKLVTPDAFLQRNTHFYLRPERALAFQTAGIVIAVLFILIGSCVYINEWYLRSRFNKRVYID